MRTLFMVLGLAGAVVVAVVAVVAWGGPLSDLRPGVIDPSAPQPEREVQGREILAAALGAHGGRAAWQSHAGQTFRLRDQWRGLWGFITPWPAADISMRVVQQRHTFDSEVTFLDGPDPGLRWGMEDWRTWVQRPDGARQWQPHDDASFTLPTVHYFVELPLRLGEAELVRYVGPRTIGAHTYDVVFLTWQSWAPNPDYDQYLVFVDVETRRIAKVQYTVRRIARFATGTSHLEAYEEVGGVLLPTRIAVSSDPEDDPLDFHHLMTFHDLAVQEHKP